MNISTQLKSIFKLNALFLGLLLLWPVVGNAMVAEKVVLTAEEQQWLARHPTFKVAAFPLAPYIMQKQGTVTGYMTELLRTVSSKVNLTPQFNYHEISNEAFTAVNTGKVEVAMGFIETPERAQHVTYSPEFMLLNMAVFSRKSTESLGSLESLKNKRIASYHGYTMAPLITEQFSDAELVMADDAVGMLQLVATGKADVALQELHTGQYMLRENFINNLEAKGFVKFEGSDNLLGHSYAVNRGFPLLQSILDKGFRALTEKEKQQLWDAWFVQTEIITDIQELKMTFEEKAWLAEHPVIRVALDPDWAPVEYKDKEGNYQGMSLDYLNHLEKLLNIRFEVAEGLTWQEAVSAVQSKKADMFASVARTPQREDYVLFTRPYVSMPINIFARDDLSYIGNLGNLAGKKVAVVENYAIHDWLKNEHPELQLYPVASPTEGLVQVSEDDVDVFVGNTVTTNYYLGKLELKSVRMAGETPYANEQAMAVRDDWPIFVGILQKSLDSITPQEHGLIFNRWLSIKFERSINQSLLWQILFAVTLVLFLILYWNVSLSNRVRQRTNQYQDELIKRQESEVRFRDLVESTSDWIWEVDLNGRYTYVSPKVEELLGYTPEELLGKTPFELMTDKEAERVALIFKVLVQEQQPFDTLENKNLHKDGHQVTIETSGVPIFNPEGECLGYRGIDRDISERKSTESVVQDIAASIAASTGAAFFRDLTVNLARALNMRYVHIGSLTKDKRHIKTFSVWFDGVFVPNYIYALEGTPCENVTNTGICIYPSDVCSQFPDDTILVEKGFESYVGVPLLNSRHETVGIMVVLNTQPLHDPKISASLMEIFAVRAAAEMERLSYEGELRLAAKVLESTTEGVVIADTEGNVVSINHAFTEISGFTEEDLLGKNPRLWKSEHHDQSFYQKMWSSLLDTGEWQGEIWNRRKNGDIYPAWVTINQIKDEQKKLTNYVSVYSDISIIKESQKRLQFLAHHDPLTNLPNRLLFTDRLEHALRHAHRQGFSVSVLFLDLDNFKQINDGLGHPIGDRLLQVAADRLSTQVRETDTVARIGGDEFAILLEGTADSERAALVAEKILTVFGEALKIDEHNLHVSASLGISIYPDDGEDVDSLVKNADAAMYRAKDKGKNQYCFYTYDLTDAALERLRMENDLREALKRVEFEVYYQPQYALSTGKMVGAEALIRWHHVELGMVPPDRFITLAEHVGLIIPIGAWVLHEACKQVKVWQDAGLDISRIGVNVAGQQIQNGDFVNIVKKVLEETGLDPKCLELEITESFIMQQADTAISVLEELRDLGVTLAIDDFGTGYSSLSYLKRLPIDRLKIDRSFIKDIPHDTDGKAIARAVIALGKSLKLNVIAEGVETEEQQRFISEEGCDEVQGYLHSRPVSAKELEKFLILSK